MYKKYCIDKIKNTIRSDKARIKYRNNEKSFIRDRKMNFEKVVLYGINKRGLTSKMEIEEFTELINMTIRFMLFISRIPMIFKNTSDCSSFFA